MEIKNVITAVIVVIVAIVTIFYFVGGSASSMTDASNNLRYANNCSDKTDASGIALKLNLSSTGNCYNSSGNNVGGANLYSLPLSGLFSTSGIVFFIIMAAILLTSVYFVFKHIRR